MRRIVVSGMGITSCLGSTTETVTAALKQGLSGIKYNHSYAELGMRSHIAGMIDLDLSELIDRKLLRFMGSAAGRTHRF